MHMYIAMTRRGQPPKRIPKRSLCHNLLRLYLQSLANTVVTHVFNKKVTVRREWFEELGLNRADAQCPSMGTYGRTGHNGVALVGTPGAAACMIAAVVTQHVEPHVLVRPRAQSCQEARACAQGGVWQI